MLQVRFLWEDSFFALLILSSRCSDGSFPNFRVKIFYEAVVGTIDTFERDTHIKMCTLNFDPK